MSWMDPDRADWQGTQDPAAPRERQARRWALLTSHASKRKQIRSVGTPNCVIRPEGNSIGWSMMSAEFQAMGKLCYEPEKGL